MKICEEASSKDSNLPTCAISVEVIHNHIVALVKVQDDIWTLWVGRVSIFDKKTLASRLLREPFHSDSQRIWWQQSETH